MISIKHAVRIRAAVSHSIDYRSSYGSSGCRGPRRCIWSSNLLSASSCARRFFRSWTIPSLMCGTHLTITHASTPRAIPGSPNSLKNGSNSASVKALLGKWFCDPPHYSELSFHFSRRLPLARPPRADVLDRAVAVQPLNDRSDLFANRRTQNPIVSIEALGGDHPAR